VTGRFALRLFSIRARPELAARAHRFRNFIGWPLRLSQAAGDRVIKTRQRTFALRSIRVESMGQQDANAKDYKKCCDHFEKHGGQPNGINTGLNTMPSKNPASAAQSKIFEAGALILLLLMIPGNGSPTD